MGGQHMPGPWRVEYDEFDQWYRWRVRADRGLVANVLGVPDDEINARLIAAAPDLLDCCRAMLELHETGSWEAPPGEYLPALRAAIAKATGEAT